MAATETNCDHCFPALAALLFRERSSCGPNGGSNSNNSSDGATGDQRSVEDGGMFGLLELDHPSFVVHCVCDFYVDL